MTLTLLNIIIFYTNIKSGYLAQTTSLTKRLTTIHIKTDNVSLISRKQIHNPNVIQL